MVDYFTDSMTILYLVNYKLKVRVRFIEHKNEFYNNKNCIFTSTYGLNDLGRSTLVKTYKTVLSQQRTVVAEICGETCSKK